MGPRPGTGREVRTLFQARLDRLPDPTRKLLLLAALDGSGGLGALAAATPTTVASASSGRPSATTSWWSTGRPVKSRSGTR